MNQPPRTFTPFRMFDDALRIESLPDRSEAGLVVTVGNEHELTKMKELPKFVPSGSVFVLNISGAFFPRFPGIELPSGHVGTVYFAQMLDESGYKWVVAVPEEFESGNIIKLPGESTLHLLHPYVVNGRRMTWRGPGGLWVARFASTTLSFEDFQKEHGCALDLPFDKTKWTFKDMQSYCTTRATSARFNNGAANITKSIVEELVEERDVRIVKMEVRTAIDSDGDYHPMPEFAQLSGDEAVVINAAIKQGRLVVPVGTAVIRALDYLYDEASGLVRDDGKVVWCDNMITPKRKPWLRACVTGLQAPDTSHMLLGAAIMGEANMHESMGKAYRAGYKFHDRGDTAAYFPSR